MNIETMMHEEIQSELEELGKIKVGTEEYKVAVEGITKLTDRVIEMTKSDIEREEKVKDREIETNLKIQQMEDERKDRFIKNVIAVVGIAVPTAVTIWGTVKSIEFEKEGTITTIMGRGFIQKLLPKK
jgi:hypothetical protein